jgi:hypothetical protein
MTRYLGGLITKDESLVLPANNFEDTSAPGVWTLEEAQALNKQGLWPTAGVSNPAKFVENIFSVNTYTGTGSDGHNIINGIDLSGEGGLVWIKDRGNANTNHSLYDTTRGVNKRLISHKTDANATVTNMLTSFNSNGFTLGQDNSSGDVNTNTNSYVAWTFRKAPKFFDVVKYTGNGTAGRTVSHNLGVAPGFIVVKRIDTAGEPWYCYHRSLGATKYLRWNTTNAATTSDEPWYNTEPTSSQVTVAQYNSANANGGEYVMYLFGHDTSSDGMIQCGNYTGIGSQITTTLGFEPQWLMYKRTDSSTGGGWFIVDSLRGWTEGANSSNFQAISNSTDAEAESSGPGLVSTGFTSNHTSGRQYIYIAIRKAPMQTPTSRASVFEVDQHHSGDPNYTTTFPVDMAINPTTLGGNVRLTSRLLGNNKKLLVDNAGSLEGGDSGQDYAHNDGVNLVDSSTYYAFMWRRAPKFFDYVRYDGNGSNRTIEHALGVTPEMIWVKNMTAYGQDWGVYYGDATDYLKLNSDAATADDNTFWNDTAPTSTVFTVGTHDSVNKNTNNHVAYLFATLAGISKVGTFSHTNGSSTDVDCGFSSGSRWVLVKRTDSTSDWYIWDTERGLVSGNDGYLVLNSTAAEVTNQDYIDPLNSGFQIASGFTTGSYMFYAIAA